MIKIPDELDVLHEYWPPELGGLYWVKKDVFGRRDNKPRRPYAVVALPDGHRPNDLVVVRRSTSAGYGVAHDAQPNFGLKSGWFCEVRNVSKELWTLRTVESIGYVLPDRDLAWVMGEFL